MPHYIIQKFGGTSVGTPKRLQSVTQIIREYADTFAPIVVVSAASGASKAEGTTSLLLRALSLARNGECFDTTLESIRDYHTSLGLQSLSSSSAENFTHFLDQNYVEAARILTKLPQLPWSADREDQILAIGERLSALLLTLALKDLGLSARFVDLSEALDLPPEGFTMESTTLVRQRLLQVLNPIPGEIPVVTGFFGPLHHGIIKTIGRGYSDFTGALLSASLPTDEVVEYQIWKEVDGVYSADPRKVPTARLLPSLSGREASELTFFGSEVIHPLTMEQVMSRGIPLRVKNVLNPVAEGSLITPQSANRHCLPAAVTGKQGVCVFLITTNAMVQASGFLALLFDVFRKHRIVVDLISTSEAGVSCTIDEIQRPKLEAALPELRRLGEVSIKDKQAIIALIGDGVTRMKHSASRMLQAVEGVTQDIEMVTQASTNVNISCVIPNSAFAEALRAVHSEFWGPQTEPFVMPSEGATALP